MKIRFTETRIVDDFRKGTSNEERFTEGRVYDLPEVSAMRWIARGAAEEHAPRKAKDNKAAAAAEAKRIAEEDAERQKAEAEAAKAAADGDKGD